MSPRTTAEKTKIKGNNKEILKGRGEKSKGAKMTRPAITIPKVKKWTPLKEKLFLHLTGRNSKGPAPRPKGSRFTLLVFGRGLQKTKKREWTTGFVPGPYVLLGPGPKHCLRVDKTGVTIVWELCHQLKVIDGSGWDWGGPLMGRGPGGSGFPVCEESLGGTPSRRHKSTAGRDIFSLVVEEAKEEN